MNKRIYANKVDYITFLMNHPELAKRIGSKLLLSSVAIMNFMLFKRGYCSTEKSSNKNRVYRGSIDSFLEHLPRELVTKAVKKLILIDQIKRTDRDDLQLSDTVLQYFYKLTGNETFNTSENSETRERDKTDNKLSGLSGLTYFRNGVLEELFERQKIDSKDFRKEKSLGLLLYIFALHFYNEAFKVVEEAKYIEDLEAIFGHFGASKTSVKLLWPEASEHYRHIQSIRARTEEKRSRGAG